MGDRARIQTLPHCLPPLSAPGALGLNFPAGTLAAPGLAGGCPLGTSLLPVTLLALEPQSLPPAAVSDPSAVWSTSWLLLPRGRATRPLQACSSRGPAAQPGAFPLSWSNLGSGWASLSLEEQPALPVSFPWRLPGAFPPRPPVWLLEPSVLRPTAPASCHLPPPTAAVPRGIPRHRLRLRHSLCAQRRKVPAQWAAQPLVSSGPLSPRHRKGLVTSQPASSKTPPSAPVATSRALGIESQDQNLCD